MADYHTGSVRSRSRSRSPPPRDFAATNDRAYLDNGQNSNYDEGTSHPSGGDVGGGGPPPSEVALYVGNLDYGASCVILCFDYALY